MVADKGKKLKGPEKGEEEIVEHVDGDLVLSIEKLQEVQDELEKINEKVSEEVLGIEQKFNEVRVPIYDKRKGIIASIPDFWLTAFLSHPALCDLLNEEDEKIFKFLSSLEVEESKDVKSGYSISFNFNENPYFEDTKITKSFTFLDDGTTKVTATSIKWKEGMGISNGATQEKKGNKRALEDDSFFTWFNETPQKDSEDEIAEVIKEDLWPNPLTYFNNEADEEDVDGEDDDDEEGIEGSEEDGEEDDEGEENGH